MHPSCDLPQSKVSAALWSHIEHETQSGCRAEQPWLIKPSAAPVSAQAHGRGTACTLPSPCCTPSLHPRPLSIPGTRPWTPPQARGAGHLHLRRDCPGQRQPAAKPLGAQTCRREKRPQQQGRQLSQQGQQWQGQQQLHPLPPGSRTWTMRPWPSSGQPWNTMGRHGTP